MEHCRLLMRVYANLMFSPKKLSKLSAHQLVVSFKDKWMVRITQKSLRNKEYNGNERGIPVHWLLTLSAFFQTI